MKKKTVPENSQFLVYQVEDGQIKIDVRLEEKTVWLTQQQMADLLQTTKQNISLHIQNIYEEGELVPEATVKKYLTVRSEGLRDVFAGSQARALIVIHKCHEARHSGRDSRQAILPVALRVNANLFQTDLCRNPDSMDGLGLPSMALDNRFPAGMTNYRRI